MDIAKTSVAEIIALPQRLKKLDSKPIINLLKDFNSK